MDLVGSGEGLDWGTAMHFGWFCVGATEQEQIGREKETGDRWVMRLFLLLLLFSRHNFVLLYILYHVFILPPCTFDMVEHVLERIFLLSQKHILLSFFFNILIYF